MNLFRSLKPTRAPSEVRRFQSTAGAEIVLFSIPTAFYDFTLNFLLALKTGTNLYNNHNEAECIQKIRFNKTTSHKVNGTLSYLYLFISQAIPSGRNLKTLL